MSKGITTLQAADIRYAEQLGYRIKLLGITKRRDDKTRSGGPGIELRVHPTLIPATRLIANVEGAMNAVVVHGDAVGTTLYYGKRRGQPSRPPARWSPTSSTLRGCTPPTPTHRVPHLAFQHADDGRTRRSCGIADVVTAFYLRLVVADKRRRAGADHRHPGRTTTISIDAVLQRPSAEADDPEARLRRPRSAAKARPT